MPKGIKGFQKGHSVSHETRKKISKNLKGIQRSQEFRDKVSNRNKTMGIKPPSNKGKRFSVEHRQAIGESLSGKKNPNWQGGKSFEPYVVDWTRTLRRSIRERDNYICQLCGETQGDIALDIHHIDYDKNNCDPKNLITLCRRCHIKTNYKRAFWKEYFNGRY